MILYALIESEIEYESSETSLHLRSTLIWIVARKMDSLTTDVLRKPDFLMIQDDASLIILIKLQV